MLLDVSALLYLIRLAHSLKMDFQFKGSAAVIKLNIKIRLTLHLVLLHLIATIFFLFSHCGGIKKMLMRLETQDLCFSKKVWLVVLQLLMLTEV